MQVEDLEERIDEGPGASPAFQVINSLARKKGGVFRGFPR